MKLNKIVILSLFIVLICFIGAVSATEDVNDTVITDSGIDEVNAVEIEQTVDDTNQVTEVQSNDESNNVLTSGTPVAAADWNSLKLKCELPTSQYITLTGNTYTIGNAINFKNSATIVGSDVSYITGGSTSKTPFVNTNSALTLHFINVKFLNVNAKNLLELDGTVYLENCTFNNVQTATGHNSVIYNTNNYMYLTGCNITNCHTGYGAVTNYNSGSTTSVIMYVDDCKFINNSASVEPGAINNCGILYVNNSEFDGNHANWWAGAIHTHTNAQTEIENTIFKRNTAGWNGGALFTYSKLKIKNCTFEDNNCTTNNGGGAIGAYNYGSGYNITICSSRFNYNTNLCYAYTNISTTSVGRGGAISVLNGGYLTVCNCNFTGNYAKIGQAIAAATYTYENGTGGNPHIKICNNRFVDHTATGIDTVVITGNDYIFNNNVFINSYQNTPYTGTGNTYNSVGLMMTSSSKKMLESLLGASNPDILTDFEYHDVIYVNISSDKDSMNDDVHGQSWDDAYGGQYAMYVALMCINENGIIYVANGDYTHEDFGGEITVNSGNFTIIGQGPKTNITNIISTVYSSGNENATHNFINLTFTGKEFGFNSNFINCTFLGPISISKDLLNYETRHIEESGCAKTYFMNFNNCVFKDVTTEGSLVTLYKYGAVNFNNCTFENIVADSLVYRNDTTYFDEDGISFKNCNFTNSKFNGVVDSAANFDQAIIIEDCTYDGEVTVGTTEVNGHFYVNATKLKVVAVETNTSISSSEKGIVTITVKDAEGNPVANANVNYTVNGENKTGITDANGTITISGLTNEVTITADFAGNDAFLPSQSSEKFNFTIPKVATAITAPKVTATYNVAKNLVITLKDINGNALAGKEISIKVGTISKNVKTNAKGQVSVNVASLVPKTYTATIKFAGDDTSLASNASPKVVVSKATPKLTTKKLKTKVKVKTKKVTVTLKDNKGKALKSTKVTLKIKGKTYKATTNKKGKATFKVTKLNKKGTFKGTVKFAGNKYFKAVSKKVTVVVKK